MDALINSDIRLLRAEQKMVRQLQDLLSKKPYVRVVNKILNKLFQHPNFKIIEQIFKKIGFGKKAQNIEDIKIDYENDLDEHHPKEWYSNLIKYVKRSKHQWFYVDSTKPVSAKDCWLILKEAWFMITRMTDRRCATLILHWIEEFSDDDQDGDAITTIKPYAMMAKTQLVLDHVKKTRSNAVSRSLAYFYQWYGSMKFNVYTPSKEKTVNVTKDQHNMMKNVFHPIIIGHTKKRFPASDERLNVDPMQDFLRPVAYMLALPLHQKVHFKYQFFSDPL